MSAVSPWWCSGYAYVWYIKWRGFKSYIPPTVFFCFLSSLIYYFKLWDSYHVFWVKMTIWFWGIHSSHDTRPLHPLKTDGIKVDGLLSPCLCLYSVGGHNFCNYEKSLNLSVKKRFPLRLFHFLSNCSLLPEANTWETRPLIAGSNWTKNETVLRGCVF